LCWAAAPPLEAQDAKTRSLRNGWEVYRELVVPREATAAVKDYFPSFFEYQDTVLYHPRVGYYASGRVSFTADFQTYPTVLAPFFGHMIAEQVFKMWEGMRSAGTLGAGERFTIAEFGPGDGGLAESILEYLEKKSQSHDQRWREFASQVLYICYDRSPSLNSSQLERNKRFGSRFTARVADATNLTETIPDESLKGVILSNELPDVFGVHKVILSSSGTAEVAFVAPSLPDQSWERMRFLVPPDIARAIEADDTAIEEQFVPGAATPELHLTRYSFVALLEILFATEDYEGWVDEFEFREVYVPASEIPELAEHLRRYAPVYAEGLAKYVGGLVTYINLGAERYIQGSAQALKAGYVLTVDYGTTWEGILSMDTVRLRTYGPARRGAVLMQQKAGIAVAHTRDVSEPYVGPTLNDMTSDVNFSLLAAEGQLVGLRPIYFGSQAALQTGTGVSLEEVPAGSKWAPSFARWAEDFAVPSVYKVLVQQKADTDDEYRFPDNDPEPLGPDRIGLPEAAERRANEIEARLKSH
jgi:SAM-dependent MidA family methyltransferase